MRWQAILLGVAIAGAAGADPATGAGVSEPAAPTIDLVDEVRHASTYTVMDDDGHEVLFSDVARAISDSAIYGVFSVFDFACLCGRPVDADWPSDPGPPLRSAFDPCLASSCTSFSGDVTR